MFFKRLKLIVAKLLTVYKIQSRFLTRLNIHILWFSQKYRIQITQIQTKSSDLFCSSNFRLSSKLLHAPRDDFSVSSDHKISETFVVRFNFLGRRGIAAGNVGILHLVPNVVHIRGIDFVCGDDVSQCTRFQFSLHVTESRMIYWPNFCSPRTHACYKNVLQV